MPLATSTRQCAASWSTPQFVRSRPTKLGCDRARQAHATLPRGPHHSGPARIATCGSRGSGTSASASSRSRGAGHAASGLARSSVARWPAASPIREDDMAGTAFGGGHGVWRFHDHRRAVPAPVTPLSRRVAPNPLLVSPNRLCKGPGTRTVSLYVVVPALALRLGTRTAASSAADSKVRRRNNPAGLPSRVENRQFILGLLNPLRNVVRLKRRTRKVIAKLRNAI